MKIKEYISVLNKSSYPDELPNSIGIQIGSNNLETNHKISLKQTYSFSMMSSTATIGQNTDLFSWVFHSETVTLELLIK